MNRLAYTKAVFEESLRIRPPASIVMRKIAKDTQLQDYRLKAGGLAVFCIYNMHYHADFWEQPEVFDPGRFMNDGKRNKAYMPFGIGHRYCIGNQFALCEGQLLLAMLLQNYDFQLPRGHIPDMEMAVTIKPKGGLPMMISRSKNSASA